MELAIFREYVQLYAPHLLDKTGVYVVQPNSLQRSLRNVHKIGKGQLQQRFRTYKQMWPDGGKVFAFFTVPTATATWTTERDIPLLRERQLIGVDAGLLRMHRYHGEWVDAELRTVVRAMQDVHNPSEGQFYVCGADAIQAVRIDKPGEEPTRVLRRLTPSRAAKEQSAKAFFLSLGSQQKVDLVRRLPAGERRTLWSTLDSGEKARNLTPFVTGSVCARPEWLPTPYAFVA